MVFVQCHWIKVKDAAEQLTKRKCQCILFLWLFRISLLKQFKQILCAHNTKESNTRIKYNQLVLSRLNQRIIYLPAWIHTSPPWYLVMHDAASSDFWFIFWFIWCNWVRWSPCITRKVNNNNNMVILIRRQEFWYKQSIHGENLTIHQYTKQKKIHITRKGFPRRAFD